MLSKHKAEGHARSLFVFSGTIWVCGAMNVTYIQMDWQIVVKVVKRKCLGLCETFIVKALLSVHMVLVLTLVSLFGCEL